MVAQYTAYDEMANLMASGMNADRLIAYQIPLKMLERYQFLTDKLKMEGLTSEENNELLSILMMNQVISLAKARMRRALAVA